MTSARNKWNRSIESNKVRNGGEETLSNAFDQVPDSMHLSRKGKEVKGN
jgi:hypothetical protein